MPSPDNNAVFWLYSRHDTRTHWGRTGAGVIAVCRTFSFTPLIYELSGVQDVYPQVCSLLCHNCVLHLKLVCWRAYPYVSAHHEASAYSTCAWLVLAARVTRGLRPECVAWFSQCADESWQLQDCLLLLVCLPVLDQALTSHYVYGNSDALCLYLHT